MVTRRLALMAALLLCGSEAFSQTVVQRSRLGHRVEDIDHIGNTVVTLDGYEVYSIPARINGRIEKILDLRGTIATLSNGMAWIQSEGLLALVAGEEPTVLRLVALDGTVQPPRTIRYLDGYLPSLVEGLAFIPGSSSLFRRHLILATNDQSGGRLQVMTTAGQVVRQIIPDAPVGPSGIGAVTYFSPDRILVTSSDNRIWTLDFNGHIVGGPIRVAEADKVEGLTVLRDGRVAAVDYYSGHLFMMDNNLSRTPAADREHPFMPGLTNLFSVAWNGDAERHLVASVSPTTSGRQVHAVPGTLDWAGLVTYPQAAGFSRARGLTYISDEKLLAIAHERTPQAILVYTAIGALKEVVGVSAAGSPFNIAYIPATKQFALRVRETNATTLRIVNRNGEFVRDLDLGASGITAVDAVSYFESGSGRFLVAGGGRIAVVDSETGALLHSFDHREKLGVLFVIGLSAITTGPHAGAFGVVDSNNNELVVFQIE